MKKLFVLCSIVIATFVLVGCETLTTETTTAVSTAPATTEDLTTTEPPATTTAPDTTTEAATTTATTTEPETTTQQTTTLAIGEDVPYDAYVATFVNYSPEFIDETPVDSILFYYYEDKEGIPYVDIEEFVQLLLGIIDETVQVEADYDALTVRIFVEWVLTEEEKIEYGITEDVVVEWVEFDFAEMRVSAKNVDSMDAFNGEMETDLSEGLNVIAYTQEELPGLSIDLADYGMLIRVLRTDDNQTKFTIPVHLAGLFLTGSLYNVVANGNTLHGLDLYQIGDVNDRSLDVFDAIKLNEDETELIRAESVNYLALVFDHFYGLKAYKKITSFVDYVSTRFDETAEFAGELYDFAWSLNDLHTGVISSGHTNPSYDIQDFYGDYGFPLILDNYFDNYYGCDCDEVEDPFELRFYQDMAYYRIDGFTFEFKDDIAADMEAIRAAAPKYVVIDITCNGGGVLAGVLNLLNYLTNDPVTLYTTTQGARSSTTYEVEGDLKIDAEFYIVTSAMTYSAANLFAAMAKEAGLAKTIGLKSGGGACSVMTLVLPNGAIIQMSSPMNLSTSNYVTLEAGVAVDYTINWKTLADYYTMAQFYTVVTTLSGD